MNTLSQLLISISFVIAVAVGSYLGFQYIGLKQKEDANQARFECAQSVRYEVRTDDTTISYPPSDLYKKCLKEKGL